MTEKS